VVVGLGRDPELTLKKSREATPAAATESGQLTEETDDGEEGESEAEATPKPSATPRPSATPGATAKPGEVVDGVTVGVSNKAEIEEPYAEILETGVGWLRVRSEPSGAGNNEVAKVKVGNWFSFVEESENEEWVKIEYAAGKEGWVSSQYVRVTE
jgi:hypothetical protein